METRLFLGEPAREARGRQVEGKQALPGDGVSGGRERRAGAGAGKKEGQRRAGLRLTRQPFSKTPSILLRRSPGEGNGSPRQCSGLESPWTTQSMRSQRVGQDWVTFTSPGSRPSARGPPGCTGARYTSLLSSQAPSSSPPTHRFTCPLVPAFLENSFPPLNGRHSEEKSQFHIRHSDLGAVESVYFLQELFFFFFTEWWICKFCRTLEITVTLHPRGATALVPLEEQEPGWPDLQSRHLYFWVKSPIVKCWLNFKKIYISAC